MAKLLRCDNCGAEAMLNRLVGFGWREITQIGMDTHVFGEVSEDLHFCSEKCIGEHYRSKPTLEVYINGVAVEAMQNFVLAAGNSGRIWNPL